MITPPPPPKPEDAVAQVRVEDGQVVIEDPIALAVIRGVALANCRRTLENQRDRVQHFLQRMAALQLTHETAAIVLINADTAYGRSLARVLVPSMTDEVMAEMRARGEVPFARGLVLRDGMLEALSLADMEAHNALAAATEPAVVVVDYDVIAVFLAREAAAPPR